jgi:hypothetical protein
VAFPLILAHGKEQYGLARAFEWVNSFPIKTAAEKSLRLYAQDTLISLQYDRPRPDWKHYPDLNRKDAIHATTQIKRLLKSKPPPAKPEVFTAGIGRPAVKGKDWAAKFYTGSALKAGRKNPPSDWAVVRHLDDWGRDTATGYVVRARYDGWLPRPYTKAPIAKLYKRESAAQKHADKLNETLARYGERVNPKRKHTRAAKPARRQRTKRNPPGGRQVLIYSTGKIIGTFYGRHRDGRKYKHRFGGGCKAIYGLPDGSIRIVGHRGRLWEMR